MEDDIFSNATEGEALAVAVHDEWVVIGIRTGEHGAMIHFPAFMARDAALKILRSADMTEIGRN